LKLNLAPVRKEIAISRLEADAVPIWKRLARHHVPHQPLRRCPVQRCAVHKLRNLERKARFHATRVSISKKPAL
jgi:hypothetical protein